MRIDASNIQLGLGLPGASIPPVPPILDLRFFTMEPYSPQFLTWEATYGFTDLSESEANALRVALQAQGWIMLGHLPKDLYLNREVPPYPLSSQLCVEYLIHTPGSPHYEVWAQESDLQHATNSPVILTCPFDASSLEHSTSGSSLEDLLPGCEAFIVEEGKPYPTRYALKQLGAAGEQLWKEIVAAQLYFIAPAYEELFKKDALNKAGEQVSPPSDEELSQLIGQLSDEEFSQLIEHLEKEKQKPDARLELWFQAQRAAKQLSALYWQLHQETLKRLQSVLQRGTFSQVPAPFAVQAVTTAYSNAQSGASAWQLTDDTLAYRYRQKDDIAVVAWRPNISHLVEISVPSLWQQIRAFSDLDSDVLLALLAHWLVATPDREGYAWISPEQILHYRGIQPRLYMTKGGELHTYQQRQESLDLINESLQRIEGTYVTVRQWIKEERTGKRGRPKKHLLQEESHVISFGRRYRQQSLPLGEGTAESRLVVWSYRPGECLRAYINGGNRQMAWVLQQVLSYDPNHQAWAKRLAYYVTFRLRLDIAGGTLVRTVQEILDELSLPRSGTRNRDRVRSRFEKTMNRLEEDHLITSWGYQAYSSSEAPGERIKLLLPAELRLKSHHWIDEWLATKVEITVAPLKELKGNPFNAILPAHEKEARHTNGKSD